MPRTASSLTLTATVALSAGLTACVVLGLSAGHAETFAPKAAPAFVSAQVTSQATLAVAAPSAAKPDAQWSMAQGRSARVVYPSHYTSQR
jgi:hypothetical protein